MRIVYACLMVVCLAIPVFAQDEVPNAADMVTKMQSQLGLTQDQVSAITPIIEKYASQRQELRQSMEDGTADANNIRRQMKQLRQAESQELSELLSAEQLSRWESMMKRILRHQGNTGNNPLPS